MLMEREACVSKALDSDGVGHGSDINLYLSHLLICFLYCEATINHEIFFLFD